MSSVALRLCEKNISLTGCISPPAIQPFYHCLLIARAAPLLSRSGAGGIKSTIIQN